MKFLFCRFDYRDGATIVLFLAFLPPRGYGFELREPVVDSFGHDSSEQFPRVAVQPIRLMFDPCVLVHLCCQVPDDFDLHWWCVSSIISVCGNTFRCDGSVVAWKMQFLQY